MAGCMIKIWKVRIQPLAEFSAHLSEPKLYLLSSEVQSNSVPHHAKETFDIVRCAGSWVLGFVAPFTNVSSSPLSSLYVCYHSYKGFL